MVCKICNMPVEDGATKCDFCGSPIKGAASVTGGQAPVSSTPEAEKKTVSQVDDMFMNPKEEKTVSQKPERVKSANNNTAIYVLLGAIVALALFIAVILLLPKGEKAVDGGADIVVENVKEDEDAKTETVQEEKEYEFFFPSDKEYISEMDLKGKSKVEVAMIRNEIFARHGYMFKTEPFKSYFEAQEWYTPNINFSVDLFNAIETANKDFILKYEEAMGWR